MSKTIVVCCDGTGNKFAADQTNVLRLHYALNPDHCQTVAYYGPGVGTFSVTAAATRFGQKINQGLGLGLGLGYLQTVEDAYWFIVEHYQPGDRIFLFGFSRGAYAVRIVAALVHGIGILPAGNRPLVKYALDQIRLRSRSKLDFKLLGRFKRQFSRPLPSPPYIFLGVWDTVSSVSWAYDYLRYAFTASNSSIAVIRHAVAIDERRALFAQNLFTQREQQDFKEVWFAGCHSDVGGGYQESESGLSKIALEWMLTEARDAGGLEFDDDRVKRLLSGKAEPDWRAPLHPSLTWKWLWAEFFPKQQFRSSIPKPHLFKRRFLTARSNLQAGNPVCKIHETAVHRKESEPGYAPSNWPDNFEIEPHIAYLPEPPISASTPQPSESSDE